MTPSKRFREVLGSYLVAAVCTAVMTIIIAITRADSSIANPPMLYLLAVQVVALFLGSKQAIFASFLCLLEFDWFFVHPRYQFTVRDPFEFVALCMFVVTAIIVGQLTARQRDRADKARRRELEAVALAEASWTIVSELDRDTALQKVVSQLEHLSVVRHAALLSQDLAGDIEIVATYPVGLKRDNFHFSLESVQSAYRERSSLPAAERRSTERGPRELFLSDVYLPVIVNAEVKAIWYIQADQPLFSKEDERVIDSLINHMAVVINQHQLIQAQAEARALAEVDRLKTALLQMVSHDFRSPLAAIKASVGSVLVEDGIPLDSQTVLSLLQAIEHETDRLNRMVGNILDLSKLEADAWRPKREETSVADLINATLDSFPSQSSKRIEVTTNDWNWEIWIDSVQIAQVLRNLLDNALKYSSPETRVEINVNVDVHQLQIEVLDGGRGIAESDLELIFEPFFRGKEHQESAMPGMGLGLAVCRGLVQAHGGTITAANRSGGGAVFKVTVPDAKPLESNGAAPMSMSQSASGQAALPVKGRNALSDEI